MDHHTILFSLYTNTIHIRFTQIQLFWLHYLLPGTRHLLRSPDLVMSPEHIIHLHSLSMPPFIRRSKAMAKAKGPLHLQLSFPIHYHLFLGLTNLFIFIYIFLYTYQFSQIFLIIFIIYLPDIHLHPPPDNHPHPDYPDPKLTPHLYLGYWAPKESWAI